MVPWQYNVFFLMLENSIRGSWSALRGCLKLLFQAQAKQSSNVSSAVTVERCLSGEVRKF